VSLCVFSVALCETKKRLHGEHRGVTELHREKKIVLNLHSN
jgi:hypothetical protein